MYNKNIINSDVKAPISFNKKIYVWSVVFEPLLFFIIWFPSFAEFYFSNDFAVRPTHISRLLQFYVIISLIIKILLKKNLYTYPNPLFSHYRYYFYYLILTFISGLYGLITSAYSIPLWDESYSNLRNNLRPIIEYIIAIYYFLYFVILFRFLIKKPEEIDYFFKIFTYMFFISLSIGFVELLFVHINIFNLETPITLPRHIYDFDLASFKEQGNFWTNVIKSGRYAPRFHGLAGEPRDAFVYLIFGLGVLSLKGIWRENMNVKNILYPIIIIALFFTQSFSGALGLIFAVILLFIFYLPKLNLKNVIIISIIMCSILLLSILLMFGSYRGVKYLKLIFSMYSYLKLDLTPTVSVGFLVNIYPIWHRFVELSHLNFLSPFIGTGLGSSAFINSVYIMKALPKYFVYDTIYNPHANIIRIIYDTGLLGLFVFTQAFIYPIKQFYGSKKILLKILFWMLVILGASYGHRSAAPFLYLGIALIICENKFTIFQKFK